MKQIPEFLLMMSVAGLVMAFLGSCSKTEEVSPDSGDIRIISLNASDTILKAWMDTAEIIVVASGEKLEYEWSCNHGTLHGTGDTVRYMAGQCCVGLNTITCKVFNDSSVVSRDLAIRVTSYFEP